MPDPVQIPISPQGMVNALTAQRNSLANENAMLLARLADLEVANSELADRLNKLEQPTPGDIDTGEGGVPA